MHFLIVVLALVVSPLPALASGGHSHAGVATSFWAVLPFAALLIAIAVLPLTSPHFWENNRNKAIIAVVAALPIVAYYLVNEPKEILYHLEEYIGFIVLLWSLYTISGGIVLKGNLAATPAVNTAFLAVGAVAANLFGTTGASMLLIRPLLRTNMERRYKAHTVVFFIFLVSNIGGCLTPLGDPPLYMGFLQGIPFTWTLRFWPPWLFANGLLLLVYYLWDRRAHARERPERIRWDDADRMSVGLDGWRNVALIGCVLATIVASDPLGFHPWLRDAILIGLALTSIQSTPKKYRLANDYTNAAIIEVAVLFLGIFITMIPALVLLEQQGASLGVSEPWQYFWATGLLSTFLDNTPTYLTFLSLAKGVHLVADVPALLRHADGGAIVEAVSIGAVFMGANSYIGNGPNFMVKAIAEQKGRFHVDMPSFGGYLLYACCILVPLFLLVTSVFFWLAPELIG